MKFRSAVCLSVIVAVTSSAFAQQLQAVRPSLMVNKGGPVTQAPAAQSSEMLLVAQKNLADKAVKVFIEKTGYQMDEALKIRLRDAILKSKTVETSLSVIASQKSAKSQKVDLLRLELMSYVGEINPNDPAQIQAAARDLEVDAKLKLAQLANGLTVSGITEEGIKNVEAFLSNVVESISTGVNAAEALDIAKRSTALDTGHEVMVDMISEAYNRPQEGVIALFKGRNDRQVYTVQGPGGVPLEISMTAAEGEKMQNEAFELAQELMSIAKDPANIHDALAERALKRLETQETSSKIFLDKNPLLDQKSTKLKEVGDTAMDLKGDIDLLLKALRRYENLVVSQSGVEYAKEKAKAMLSSVPLIGAKFQAFEESLKTEADKIREIENRLLSAIAQVKEQGKQLMDIKLRGLKHRQVLDMEIARVSMISDYVLYLAKEVEATDADLAMTLRSEISQSLERKKNNAMTLNLALHAADKAFSQLITQGNQLIEQGVGLAETAIPIIAISQTAKKAGETLESVAKQQAEVRDFLASTFKALEAQLSKNAETINKMAKLPLVEPEVLKSFEDTMDRISKERTQAMFEAANVLREVNNSMAEMMNASRQSGNRDTVGLAAHSVIHDGAGAAKSCARSASGK